MQLWTGEERAFTVKAYYQNGESLVWARRTFCTHFNVPRNQPVPSNHAINTWVANFEVSGSTSKKRGGSQKTVRTPENIERVREVFKRSLRRSAVRHATALGITPRYVRRILHNDLRSSLPPVQDPDHSGSEYSRLWDWSTLLSGNAGPNR